MGLPVSPGFQFKVNLFYVILDNTVQVHNSGVPFQFLNMSANI